MLKKHHLVTLNLKITPFVLFFFIFMISFSLKIAFRKDLINMLNIINEKMGKVL